MINPCLEMVEERVVYKIYNRETFRYVSIYTKECQEGIEFFSEFAAKNAYPDGRFLNADKYEVVKATRHFYKETK